MNYTHPPNIHTNREGEREAQTRYKENYCNHTAACTAEETRQQIEITKYSYGK